MSDFFEGHNHPMVKKKDCYYDCEWCKEHFDGEAGYYCKKCDFYMCTKCYTEELKNYQKKIAEEDVESRYDFSYIKDVKHEGMDPIKYLDLKKAFAYVDVDKSGTIEIEELENELKKLRNEVAEMYPDLELDEIIEMIISKCDKNGDRRISFKEMVDLFTVKDITDLKNKNNTDTIYEEFKIYGEDIDIKTLKKVCKDLGEDPEDCERMFFFADADGDGIVSKEEFHAVLNMSEDELMERAKAWKEYKSGEGNTGSKKLKSTKKGRK